MSLRQAHLLLQYCKHLGKVGNFCCRKVNMEMARLNSRRDSAGKMSYEFNDYNDYDAVSSLYITYIPLSL